jgi:hypothetical protein
MRTRAFAACVAAVAALTATAGCGGHTGGGGVGAKPSAAARVTATAATSTAATDSGPAARQALTAAAGRLAASRSADFTAVADIWGKRSTLSGTCTWGAGGFRTEEFADVDSLGMRKFVTGPTIETRQIGTALYFHVNPQPSGPVRGKRWIKVDQAAYSGARTAGAVAGSLGNPETYLRDLAAAGDVRRVGTETVAGKETVHYSGHVQASAVQKSLGLVAPSAVDAWLTADGTLVRYRRDTSGIEVTVDYLRFGGKPPVAVPPAGETADRTAAVAAAVAKQRKGQS